MYHIVVVTLTKVRWTPPKIWLGCRNPWCCTCTQTAWKGLSLTKKLSGESRAGFKLVQIWLQETKKEDILGFYGGWRRGATRVKVPSHGLVLTWFELPTGTKGMRTQTFLPVFPGVGIGKRGVVGLESCQQIQKMDPDSLLYTSYLSSSFFWLLSSLNSTKTCNSSILPIFSALNLSVSSCSSS